MSVHYPPDGFIPARDVWERYGVTNMSLYRWERDAALEFPKPIYIGRFRFWRVADLVEWENSRPRAAVKYVAAARTRDTAASPVRATRHEAKATE